MMRNFLVLFVVSGCYNPDISSGGLACNSTLADTECPDGYTCQIGACTHSLSPQLKSMGANGCCVKVPTGDNDLPTIEITKSGPPYSGVHTDPGLNSATDCPDVGLESNDGPQQAVGFPGGGPVPDMPTAKIVKMAICPAGNAPWSGRHDVDVFSIDNTAGPSTLTLMAEVFYDISMGDLDVGIFTYDGHQMNSLSQDGTAVSNGCAAANISNGIYYVAVTGANNVDSNRYELLIRSFAAAKSCPTM
jgi:hypothetical protein